MRGAAPFIFERFGLSPVLGVDLEVALSVEANGADFGSLGADAYMSAVAALPDRHSCLTEHFVCLDIACQRAVALLVVLFDRSHAAELFGEFVKTLLVSLACETVVHVGPLVVLAFGCMLKVDLGVLAETAKCLEPKFGVFFLVVGCF